MSDVTSELSIPNKHPLNKGIIIAKTIGNMPNENNDFNFFPLEISRKSLQILCD
jgi:hypothetical protein